jgi:hypothetical protein
MKKMEQGGTTQRAEENGTHGHKALMRTNKVEVNLFGQFSDRGKAIFYLAEGKAEGLFRGNEKAMDKEPVFQLLQSRKSPTGISSKDVNFMPPFEEFTGQMIRHPPCSTHGIGEKDIAHHQNA